MWLYVVATLATTIMTEAQCRAIAAKVETVKGHRMAACLSPDGSWWPTEIGPIAPKLTRIASR
jgi:hypothetical protein